MKASSENGQALVEFALGLPVLILLLLPTVDFGRALYFSSTLTNAVRAGAQYGTVSGGNAADSAGMTAAAVAAGTDIGLKGLEVTTADRYWLCSNNLAGAKNTNFPIPDASCPGDFPVTYVRVIATKDFTTMFSYPWFDNPLTMTREADMPVG